MLFKTLAKTITPPALIIISSIAQAEIDNKNQLDIFTYQIDETIDITAEYSSKNENNGLSQSLYRNDYSKEQNFHMLGVSYKRFLNKNNYLKINLAQSFEGETKTNFAFNQETDLKKNSFDIIIGHQYKSNNSYGRTYFGANISKNDYAFKPTNNLIIDSKEDNSSYSFYIGHKYSTNFKNDFNWFVDFQLTPFLKHNIKNEAVMDLKDFSGGFLEQGKTTLEQDAMAIGANINTGIKYRFNRLSAALFYQYSYFQGGGDAEISYDNYSDNTLSFQQDGNIDNYTNKSHTIGFNLGYQF